MLTRVRDDEDDGIADVAHALARQQRARRGNGRRAVAALARAIARHVAHAVGGQVGACEHGEDARSTRRRARVDPDDARVGVGRAHEHPVRLARHVEVVGVAAEAVEQPRVLDAAHGLPDGELLDGNRLAHYLSFRSSAGPMYG